MPCLVSSGPWNCKCPSELVIVTQCVAPSRSKIDDEYLIKVLLKINGKVIRVCVVQFSICLERQGIYFHLNFLFLQLLFLFFLFRQ